MRNCTFQPRILHRDIDKKKNILKKSGVDKFLERQKKAREEK